MHAAGAVKPVGDLGLVLIRKDSWVHEQIKQFNPRSELGKYVKSILHLLPKDAAAELIGRLSKTLVVESSLYGKFYDSTKRLWINLGLMSDKLVTDNGVGYIVDAFQNLVELENMKYHGLGTGTTAEAQNQTALITELTTQYAVDSTRPAGTTTETSANIYSTVATNTLDGTAAVTEHGVFSAASAGVLLDRSVFSAVNMVSGDGLQTTYNLTLTAGG